MINVAKNNTVVNPKVNCNSCRKEFKLKKSMIRKEWVTSEIERSFFICPHCKRKYTICYEDNEFRDNIEKMSKLRKRMSELNLDINNIQAKDIIEEYKKYHERNIEISKSYRAIYDK